MTDIVSWNIQYGRGADGAINIRRMARLLAERGAPDVICLQEVCTGFQSVNNSENQVQLLQEEFPNHVVLFGSAIKRWDAGVLKQFGNAILSRLPVVSMLEHPLPRPPDKAVHMQRVLVEAIIRVSDSVLLRVATTHLEANSTLQRTAQVGRIKELANQWTDMALRPPLARDEIYAPFVNPAGTVICGDFNFTEQDECYDRMIFNDKHDSGRLLDAWRVLHDNETHSPTCGIYDRDQWPRGPHVRDFFYVSQSLIRNLSRYDVDTVTQASDHQPIFLSLEMSR